MADSQNAAAPGREGSACAAQWNSAILIAAIEQADEPGEQVLDAELRSSPRPAGRRCFLSCFLSSPKVAKWRIGRVA
ncbi:MAG: hypothetical protein WBS24_06805 [Terriglobales bacterium]